MKVKAIHLNKQLYTILGSAVVSLALFGGQTASAAEGGHQFVADVNGDGHADAITFDVRTGDWWAAMSNGVSEFQTSSRWVTGFGIGTSRQFLADVTGDGKADAVTFDRTTGDWWVALSTGSSFNISDRWVAGHGYGSKNQLMGDVNGDGKADAVVFFDGVSNTNCGLGACSGSWFVATSNLAGSAFDAPGNWLQSGHGVGSSRQFLADATGDGKADAVVWSAKTGDWWIANSDGIHFSWSPNKWIAGHGVGSSDQFLNDVSGDGKADAIVAFGSCGYISPPGGGTTYQCFKHGGRTWVSTSSGSSFNTPSTWHDNFGVGVSSFMFGDVFATSNEDLVSFDATSGDWWVLPASDKFDVGVSWISGFGVGTN